MGARGWILLAGLWLAAYAWADCGPGPELTGTSDMGPRHHPVGRALPQTRSFNQPDGCQDGVWFFDQNSNQLPDPGEPTLYGPQRLIACASCHAESPDPTATSATVFLRQNAKTLCLVCHNI